MKEGVSFILPFYNAQATLVRAIESILKLKLIDFEIICINDGSQDLSSKIAKNYISDSDNELIKLVDLKKNLGVSNARNIGINLASKKYLFFIDSDDVIGMEFFKDIDGLYDIILGNHYVITEGGYNNSYDFGYSNDVAIIGDDIKVLIRKYILNPVGNSIITHCWGKLYNRDFILNNNITFDEGLSIYEDMKFVSTCLCNAKNVFISTKHVYVKNISNNGLGRGFMLSPFAYQETIIMLSNNISSQDRERQELYDRANLYFVAKILFLSRKFEVNKIVKLISDLNKTKCLSTYSELKIQNKSIYFIIKMKLYKIPLIAAIILRTYGLLSS